MATAYHILHDNHEASLNAEGMRFAIVVSEWNSNITDALCEGAVATLLQHGVDEEDIIVKTVPGSFELTFGAAAFLNQGEVDAVIVLGCVVRGETPHFDYVCQGVTQGIAELNTDGYIPVIFGVLTTDNMEQAKERAGGKLGNKGSECAETAIKMINFACSLQK